MSQTAHTLPFDLTIRTEIASGRPLVPFLRKHVLSAHAIVRPALGELSVALVGDAKMGELHQRFMGIAGPTDVLTFPLEVDRRGRVTGGEVVVCLPEARRRARELGTELKRELLLYALHGLLHLCGYDDRTDRAYAKMHRTEDEILSQLGVGPVFSPHRTVATTSSPSRMTRPAAAATGGRLPAPRASLERTR